MYHHQPSRKNFNQIRNNLDVQDDKDAIVDFVLNSLGRAPPPASFFRQMVDKTVPPPTIESLQARLQTEKEFHRLVQSLLSYESQMNDLETREELEQIYDFQVAQREKLYKEQRMAMDGGDYYPDPKVGDRPKDVDRVSSLPLSKQTWASTLAIRQQTYTFDDTIQRFNQGFIESQWPLQRELKHLQKQEEDRRNTILLPQTLAEFELIPKAHQIIVARTLESSGRITLPPNAQVSPIEVEALFRSYQTDVAFQARVKGLLASIQSSDPRKRAQA